MYTDAYTHTYYVTRRAKGKKQGTGAERAFGLEINKFSSFYNFFQNLSLEIRVSQRMYVFSTRNVWILQKVDFEKMARRRKFFEHYGNL